ncbi:EamA family transporter [Nonomuraea fuscirosea]
MEAVWARMAGAGLLLVAVLAVVRPRALRIPRSRVAFVCLYAIMAVAGVQSLYFAAITRLPVGIALLLVYMAPVMVVAWVRLVRRARPAPAAYAGAVVAIAGLGLVAWGMTRAAVVLIPFARPWALVGERLGAFQIVGGLILLSGALLAQTATRLGAPRRPAAARR